MKLNERNDIIMNMIENTKSVSEINGFLMAINMIYGKDECNAIRKGFYSFTELHIYIPTFSVYLKKWLSHYIIK
jgi:hypothetical protein